MPDASTLLAATAGLTRALAAATVLALVALWLRRRRAARAPGDGIDLGGSAERAAMLVIVAYVLVTRLAFSDSLRQPRWYFPQVGPLYAADALQAGEPWRRWLEQLRDVQITWEHQSPIMAPVATAAQALLGPSLFLPTLVGACWSLAAVLLAWRLGRAAASPLVGVLFAGFVAASPLQLTWARLGGIYIGAPAHVLLVLWFAWVVGRWRGLPAALLLGLAAWASVYHYFAARVGIALAPVALWAGWRCGGRGAGRLAALLTAFTIGLGACVGLHRLANPTQSLWPSYRGYVGSRGEADRWQVLAGAASDLRRNTGTALGAYFWRDRMGPLAAASGPSRWTGTVLQPDLSGGGLVLVPVALLGALGLLRCLRQPLAQGLWLAFALASFLPIVLGVPSARRFLVFDVAWCALAALGLSWLLHSRWLAHLDVRTRRRAGAGVLALIGTWSAAAVALGAAALPPHRTPIPFAESGFGDGLTCLACVRAARSWQHEIEDGRMVVLFDADLDREDRTAPAGLWLYGKLAALAAGHPERFLDFYALMSNFDFEPPRVGHLEPRPPDDVAQALARRIDAAGPRAIVWWFTQPGAWETAVADALAAAGGSRSHPTLPPTALGDRPAALAARALRVETPWDRRDRALRALRRLIEPETSPACVRLERVAVDQYPAWPLALADIPGAGQRPHWAIASWHTVFLGDASLPSHELIGLEVAAGPDGTLEASSLDVWGTARQWTAGAASRKDGEVPGPRPLGRACAALHRGQWWRVDPVSGTLIPPGGQASIEFPGGAVGIVSHGDALLVATADQRLLRFDPDTAEAARSVPATVPPARHLHYGECTMLASGDGWVAILDQLRGLLSVYSGDGMPLGRLSLADAVGARSVDLHAIRGAGEHLGVAHGSSVTTFRLVADPACAAAPAP